MPLNIKNYSGFVTSVLVGGRFYPVTSESGSSTRLYIGASAGGFRGSVSGQEITIAGITTESRSSVAFGGNVNAGLDILLSDLFMLGFFGGYNLMGDFDEPIGGETNFSGAYAGASISLLFGGK